MKVQINYEPGENELEADELLVKAIMHHANGGEHKQAFHDAAPREVFNLMILKHEATIASMMKDIESVLDEDVKNGNQ